MNTRNSYFFSQHLDTMLDPVRAQLVRCILLKLSYSPSYYTTHVKPGLGALLSFVGLLWLTSVCLIISVTIVINTRAPIFFKHKSVPQLKTFNYIY